MIKKIFPDLNNKETFRKDDSYQSKMPHKKEITGQNRGNTTLQKRR